MLLAGQKSYFAKRSHFGCQKLIPADENAVCQAKGNIKVILPNKPNSSSSSRNKDTSAPVIGLSCSAWAGVLFARPAAFRSRSTLDRQRPAGIAALASA